MGYLRTTDPGSLGGSLQIGLPTDGDGWDFVSDRISRSEIERSDEHNELGEAERDAEPEDDKTIEVARGPISASYLSGNASTCAWLHLRFPQKLGKDAITQLNREIVRKKE